MRSRCLCVNVKVRDADSASRKRPLLRVVTEVGAPMRTEPRLSVASAIDIRADSHIVAGYLAVEMRGFVHSEGLRGGIPATAVLVEMKLRAHRRVSASVSVDRHDTAARINDLLVRLDAMLSEGERERAGADALVAEPIGLRRPETDFVRARLAANPVELIDLSTASIRGRSRAAPDSVATPSEPCSWVRRRAEALEMVAQQVAPGA